MWGYQILIFADMGTLGSVKKRAAPLPPPTSAASQQYNYSTLPTSHSRSPSDPNPSYHTLNHHKRSPSTDSTRGIHLGNTDISYFLIINKFSLFSK